MRHARDAALRDQADALADREGLVGLLHDGAQFAVVESDGELHAGLACDAFFRGRADQAAGYRAEHRADRAAPSATDTRTRNAADGTTGDCADRGLGAFDGD